jgi:SRSO17 transposase
VGDLESLLTMVRPRFHRAEPRQHAETYVRGLLSDLARKNGWTLAAYAGARDATSMQRMLNAARWDTDGVRDDVRDWVVGRLGDWSRATLVVDEIRFPKAGSGSVGVHRVAAGTHPGNGRALPAHAGAPGAGRGHRALRAGNAQVAVFMTVVMPRGRALVDRELFLPQEWVADRARARRLGIPDDVGFADRDELAIRMIGRALDAHGPAAWVVAGGSIATSVRLRTWLEERAQAYVLPAPADLPDLDANRLAEKVPRSAWLRVEPGADAQWALASHAGARPGGRWERGVLLRRRPTPASVIALYRCQYPRRADLAELVRAARAQSAVRASVRMAIENVGLDQYQVRRYDAWYRHMTLCLLAAASLAV